MLKQLGGLCRHWLWCPLFGFVLYWFAIRGMMSLSHWIDSRVRFTGLELLAAYTFGPAGGVAIAIACNLADMIRFKNGEGVGPRVGSAFLVGGAFALNGLLLGWFLILPVLVMWHVIDPTIPWFQDVGERGEWRRWCNIGAVGFAITAFVAAFAVQYRVCKKGEV